MPAAGQVPLRHRLLRADQGAPLRPRGADDPARPRLRRRFRRPVRGARRAAGAARDARASRGSTGAACASPISGSTRVERTTTLHFDPAPDDLERPPCALGDGPRRQERVSVVVKIGLRLDRARRRAGGRAAAHAERLSQGPPRLRRTAEDQRRASTSANELFNTVVDRAVVRHRHAADRHRLGPLSLCRHPLVSTIFGRDGIITAMELLWARRRSPRAC